MLCRRTTPARHSFLLARSGDQAFTLRLLAGVFAPSADCFSFFSCRLLRWLLVVPLAFQLPKNAFTLHLLFQNAQCLVNVVVTDEYLQDSIPSVAPGKRQAQARYR